jgi:hypothetical protein
MIRYGICGVIRLECQATDYVQDSFSPSRILGTFASLTANANLPLLLVIGV